MQQLPKYRLCAVYFHRIIVKVFNLSNLPWSSGSTRPAGFPGHPSLSAGQTSGDLLIGVLSFWKQAEIEKTPSTLLY